MAKLVNDGERESQEKRRKMRREIDKREIGKKGTEKSKRR